MLCCCEVEAIATKILKSKFRTGWPVRYIHSSNGNDFFSLLPIFFSFLFPPSQTRLLSDLTTWVTRRVSYKKQEILTIRDHLNSPSYFLVGSVVHVLIGFCVVFLVLFDFRSTYRMCLEHSVGCVSGLSSVHCSLIVQLLLK